MKICIPVIGKNAALVNLMADDFYKANFYCVYDEDSNLKEVLSKEELITLFGLDLRKSSNGSAIRAIISPNVRPLAYKILVDHGIGVFHPTGKCVDENIRLFTEKLLGEYDASGVEELRGCASGCSSCSSDSCK